MSGAVTRLAARRTGPGHRRSSLGPRLVERSGCGGPGVGSFRSPLYLLVLVPERIMPRTTPIDVRGRKSWPILDPFYLEERLEEGVDLDPPGHLGFVPAASQAIGGLAPGRGFAQNAPDRRRTTKRGDLFRAGRAKKSMAERHRALARALQAMGFAGRQPAVAADPAPARSPWDRLENASLMVLLLALRRPAAGLRRSALGYGIHPGRLHPTRHSSRAAANGRGARRAPSSTAGGCCPAIDHLGRPRSGS